ncbi:hypothetical protein [Ornithinimicrobium kibberense]|uniref:hypothetical protein n=1 Tax=Ornithinimicrobium kibberense TaxID=282060 RepID=UPI003610B7C7
MPWWLATASSTAHARASTWSAGRSTARTSRGSRRAPTPMSNASHQQDSSWHP